MESIELSIREQREDYPTSQSSACSNCKGRNLKFSLFTAKGIISSVLHQQIFCSTTRMRFNPFWPSSRMVLYALQCTRFDFVALVPMALFRFLPVPVETSALGREVMRTGPRRDTRLGGTRWIPYATESTIGLFSLKVRRCWYACSISA